eukprot:350551-Chlamydomonas_euryale.AAC.3
MVWQPFQKAVLHKGHPALKLRPGARFSATDWDAPPVAPQQVESVLERCVVKRIGAKLVMVNNFKSSNKTWNGIRACA